MNRANLRNVSKTELQAAQIVKGFANHRRIQVLCLLAQEPELSLQQISEQLNVSLKTISEHVRRMAAAGLIRKRYEGRWVRHKLTTRGTYVLKFLRGLQ